MRLASRVTLSRRTTRQRVTHDVVH